MSNACSFPNLQRILAGGEFNEVKARSVVPGVLSDLANVERSLNGLKLTDEQVASLHSLAQGNDLTDDEMRLLKEDPLKFLADHKEAALSFASENVRRNVKVRGITDPAVGITYRTNGGQAEELIIFPNSESSIGTWNLLQVPGKAGEEAGPKTHINLNYMSVGGSIKAQETLALINTALAA